MNQLAEWNAAWERFSRTLPDRLKNTETRALLRAGFAAGYPAGHADGVESVRSNWREEMRREIVR